MAPLTQTAQFNRIGQKESMCKMGQTPWGTLAYSKHDNPKLKTSLC